MDKKLDYYEDVQLFKDYVTLYWTTGLIVALFLYPIFVSDYYVFIANLVMVHIILVVGLNILVGNTGQISLGHAGFFAIGAYGVVLLMTKLCMPFFIALILAAFIAALFGFVIGLPALRLEGPYLTIATLGFGLAITHFIGHTDVFGGRIGLQAPPLNIGIPQLGLNLVLESDKSIFYLILFITIFLVIAAINILNTKVGRAFVAIRDSDVAAEAMGVNLARYKTLAFALSAFYAGIAGGLYGFVLGFFDPQTFNLVLSIIFLVMVILGGLGSVMGSITGAMLVTYLQYDLLKQVKDLPLLGEVLVSISEKWFTVIGLANINSIVLGMIMIAVILFEPLGLYGIWLRTKKYWKAWPF